MSSLSFETQIKSFPEFAGMHYLEVSRENVEKLGGKFLRRYVCNVNGLKYQCALQSWGNGSGWISINKARMKSLDVSKGSVVLVELRPDKSKYGLPMPKELKQLFRRDKVAERRFEQLSPGKQRNILHYVGNHKKSQTRLDRAVTLMKNLKKLKEGKETFAKILGVKTKFNRQS